MIFKALNLTVIGIIIGLTTLKAQDAATTASPDNSAYILT